MSKWHIAVVLVTTVLLKLKWNILKIDRLFFKFMSIEEMLDSLQYGIILLNSIYTVKNGNGRVLTFTFNVNQTLHQFILTVEI